MFVNGLIVWTASVMIAIVGRLLVDLVLDREQEFPRAFACFVVLTGDLRLVTPISLRLRSSRSTSSSLPTIATSAGPSAPEPSSTRR